MELDKSLQKAELLLNQDRYGEAQKEVRTYLATDPNSTRALMLLTRTYLGMDQNEKADETANDLLKLAPSDPYVLYIKGLTVGQLGKRKQALEFLDNALSLHPMMSEAHGLKSILYFQKAEFGKALQAANEGLAIDPENEVCLNQRSRCLLQLGDVDAHLRADRQALKSNPLNPDTHATLGHGELIKGNFTKANEHFREALRIDPNHDFARQGLLHSIKATNLYYRLFLKYSFWMEGLKPQVKWAIIILGYLGIRTLSRYAGELGAFDPVAQAIIVIYIIFAISTWIIDPVSNIFLRFHPFGQLVLSAREKRTATICAGLLSAALIGLILLLTVGEVNPALDNLNVALIFIGIAMTIVVSSIGRASLEKSKRNLKMAGTFFCAACVLWLVLIFVQPLIAVKLFSWLVYGFIGYQFYANTQE